VNSALYLDTKK